MAKTQEAAYTERLIGLQKKSWKAILDVQRPYRWNLQRLRPGRTIEVGCGIGRCLAALPIGSIGIDHNAHSIDVVNNLGLNGLVSDDFRSSSFWAPHAFDSLLLAHVLEHMPADEGADLIREYATLVKPGGLAILICPQEKGFASDNSHVVFLDDRRLGAMLVEAGFAVERSYSFPFPRIIGRIFPYNEFVVVGRKIS